MIASEGEEIADRESGPDEFDAGAQRTGIGFGVPGHAVVVVGDEHAGRSDGSDRVGRNSDARSERVEIEERTVGFRATRRHDGGGERFVGGTEFAADEAADHGEAQTPITEFTDAFEPSHMVGAVPRDATVAARRFEQPTLLVEADRVDGRARDLGQFLDAVLRVAHEARL